MKLKLLTVVLIIVTNAGFAQTKSKSVSSRSNTSSNTLTNWGIGIRLGDPMGLSFKKYLPKGRALEFNLGRSAYWGYDYRDRFYNRDKYKDYDYLDYDHSNAISLQAHYLFHKRFPNVNQLQWYWGLGPQLRFKTYEYYYRFREYFGPDSDDYIWVHSRDKVTDLDFGADAVIGLEYRIPNSQLSLFGDVNILMEIFDDPFRFYGQGGVGIRFNIK